MNTAGAYVTEALLEASAQFLNRALSSGSAAVMNRSCLSPSNHFTREEKGEGTGSVLVRGRTSAVSLEFDPALKI